MIAMAFSLAAAGLFLTLGLLLGRRPVEAALVPAWNLFRTWWFSVAAITAVGPLQVLLFQMQALPVWLFLAMRQTEFIAICVALWALLCYLVFAYRGSRGTWPWLGVAYGVLAFGLLSILARAGHPRFLVLEGHRVEAEPGLGLSMAMTITIFVLLLGPQIVAAVAYAKLYFHVRHPTQRFRVALVAAAIIGWFGTRLVGAAVQAEGAAWDVARSAVALAAAALVLVAYFPPRWVQQRTGVETL